MELPVGMWVALWVGAQASWGAPASPCLPAGEETCYRLVRRPLAFPFARGWCQRRGSHLLSSWDRRAEEALRSQLEDGRWSWVGPGARVPQEQGQHRPGEGARTCGSGVSDAGARAAAPTGCRALVRVGDRFWARGAACFTKLFFICQSGPDRTHGEAADPQERRSTCRRLSCRRSPPRRPRRTTAEPPSRTAGPESPPRGTRPGTSGRPRTPSTGAPASAGLLFGTTGQELRTTREEAPRQPSDAPRPASVGQAKLSTRPTGRPPTRGFETAPPAAAAAAAAGELVPGGASRPPPSDGTESPGPAPLPSGPQDLSPEGQAQVLEKLLGQSSQSAEPLRRPDLEREARRLKALTSFPALLSGAAQASASHALLSLSAQLLRGSQRVPPDSADAAAGPPSDTWQDLFQTLGNLLQAADLSSEGQGKGEVAPEETLASLPLIQRGLLLDSPPVTTTVVTSLVLSTTLSRGTAASLPHSTFHLPQPKPLTVTFPSSPVLEPLLGQNSHVQVRVASFALNPFRYLDGKPIGSVASVALAAKEDGEGPLCIQGLAEEIEIELGGEAGDEEASAMSSVSGLGPGRFGLAVNVTSLADALLVSIRPSCPLRIALRLLGPPPPGNSSRCLLNSTLLEGQREEEDVSTWVIPPENLHHGLGTYYISGEVAPALNGTWNLSVGILSTGCYYWASQDQAWRTDGCRVGPRSSLRSTQCLCSHLSFFGRLFLVLPHAIDLQNTGLLLSRVGQNPAGVALLGGLLLGYAAFLFWALRKQKADARKATVTILADNDRSARFLYLVQVFTGYRRGAGTSAQVVLTLYGAEGRSRPHLLQHPEPLRGFERGEMDAFLLATRRPLGDLHAVRLWHNEAGPNPSWFVSRLVVQDLSARKRWHFLCNCWLASDMDDGQVDKVFVAASQAELLSFRHLFWAGLVRKVMQEHLWLSVLTCSAWSPFTRVQRLSCCLALLLCSMLINIMFWKEATGGQPPPPKAGPFAAMWRELVVSIQAAVLMLPVHLLIVHLFQLVGSDPGAPQLLPAASAKPPHPPLPPAPVARITHLQQELMETLGFLYKNILWRRREADSFPGGLQQVPELVGGLWGLVHSHLQCPEDPGAPPQERSRSLHSYLCHVMKDLEAQLRNLDWSSLPKPYDHLHAVEQLRKLWKHLEQHPPLRTPASSEGSSPSGQQSSPATEDAPQEKPAVLPFLCCPRQHLPSRFSFICWLLVGTVSLASAFFTVLYSLKMSREQASSWAISILLSVLQSLFLIQPLKVLVLTALFSLMRRKQLWQDEGQEQQLHRVLSALVRERQRCPESPGAQGCAGPLPRPPALKPTARTMERALKEKKLHSLLREIVGQLVFLAILMVLSYAERSPSEFYLNAALQRRLTAQLDDVRAPREFYTWARGTLLPAIYADAQRKRRDPMAGLAMEGNSCLVGSVRLRQIRAEEHPPRPRGPFPLQGETEGPATPHWGPPGRDEKGHEEGAWAYQSESTLQEHPIWSRFALYPGSGYLANLGSNASHAKRILRHLERHVWLDSGTRAVFVELVVYNVNVNLFCAVTLILESNGIGALQSKAELRLLRLYPSSHALVHMVCVRFAFVVLLLGQALVQGRRLVQQKRRYFGSKRNLLDVSILLLGLAAFGLYIKRSILAQRILVQHRQDRHRFISLYEMADVDSALTYLIAFLVALATIKLWNLLRLNARMQLITQTLQAAWEDLLGFLLVLLVLLAGYSMVCNLLFGWSISDYKTFLDSAVTIVGLLIGIFDYEEVIALDPVLGSILIATSIFSMVFVILNLSLSVLLTVFGREMKAAKASKEESILQLLHLKLSLLFGIKKQAPLVAAAAPKEAQH